jgi:peptidoglycan/LPS O-acetylase OafA/YrhL
MVVADHFLYSFYASVIAGPGTLTVHGHVLYRLFFGLPFGFLVNGEFAVMLFFVLSGLVLTIQFYELKDTKSLIKQGYKRYLRLGIPVFATILVGYLFASSVMLYSAHMEQYFGGSYVGSHWNIHANFFQALYQGTVGVLLGAHENYNPVLWTMNIELLGSFAVFAFAGLFGKLSTRWFFYIGVILLMWQSYLVGFFVGAIIADLYVNRQKFFAFINRVPTIYKVGVLGVVAVLGSFPPIPDTFVYHMAVFRFLLIPGVSLPSMQMIFYTSAATICIVLALASPRIQAFLNLKVCTWLGDNSFSMYLLHIYVVAFFATTILPHLLYHFSYNLSAVFMLGGIVAIIIPSCMAWTKYVDEPAVRLSRKFGDYMLALQEGEQNFSVPSFAEALGLAHIIALIRRVIPINPEIEPETD